MVRAQGPLRRAMAIACVFFVVSCGDDGGGVTEPEPPQIPVEREPWIANVEVTPSTGAVSSVGSNSELTAVAKDENGRVMQGIRFVWQSSDPSVVVVDSAGRVVSKGPGSAVVTAGAGGVQATCRSR